jgi:transglutaminase-like putative cysteine protease
MFLPGLLLTLSALPADPPAAGYVLETADARRVEATLTYTVRYDRHRAKEWVVFAARAPELPGQAKVESRLEPGGAAAKELSPLRRPVLAARVPVRQKDQETTLSIRVTYEATLRSRRLKPLAADAAPPKVEPPDKREREAALAALGEIDHKSEAVQAWLKGRKLRREEGEADVDFARRVFRDIRAGFRYEYKPDADRHASAVCRAGRSDCGGLSGLFVAALRANGVPARTLYGRWARSAEAGEKLGDLPYYQAHVKAEFYADGVGWVPVDVASGILHDRSKDGLAFFGNDRGDFLTFHVDPSLELDTRVFGRKVTSGLQVPAHWVAGPGTPEASTITEGWEVKNLP